RKTCHTIPGRPSGIFQGTSRGHGPRQTRLSCPPCPGRTRSCEVDAAPVPRAPRHRFRKVLALLLAHCLVVNAGSVAIGPVFQARAAGAEAREGKGSQSNYGKKISLEVIPLDVDESYTRREEVLCDTLDHLIRHPPLARVLSPFTRRCLSDKHPAVRA